MHWTASSPSRCALLDKPFPDAGRGRVLDLGPRVLGPLSVFPEKTAVARPRCSPWPAEGIVDCIRQQVDKVAGGEKNRRHRHRLSGHHPKRAWSRIRPNFHQAQGICVARCANRPRLSGETRGSACSYFLMTRTSWAAGIAATQGKLNKLLRVWTLGNGVGFGPLSFERRNLGRRTLRRYFWIPKKNFCGLRAERGHLEGILGLRLHTPEIPGPRAGKKFLKTPRTGDARLCGICDAGPSRFWPPPRAHPVSTWKALERFLLPGRT